MLVHFRVPFKIKFLYDENYINFFTDFNLSFVNRVGGFCKIYFPALILQITIAKYGKMRKIWRTKT